MKKGSGILPKVLVDFQNRRLSIRSTLGSLRLNFGTLLGLNDEQPTIKKDDQGKVVRIVRR